MNESYHFTDLNDDGRADLLVGRNIGNVEHYENIKLASGESEFRLITEEFYGLGIDNTNTFPSITTGDLDQNGVPELIIANSNGNFRIFPDFLNDLQNQAIIQTPVVYHLDVEKNLSHFSGTYPRPVVVNLFNEDLPSLMIGNGEGGFSILRNKNAIPLPFQNSVSVYPTIAW